MIALNLKRRHLSASQAAAIAVEALGLYEAEAKERTREAGRIGGSKGSAKLRDPSIGKASDHAAASTGASPRYVEDAKKIRERAPERFAAIKRAERKLGTLIPEQFKRGRPGKRFQRGTFRDFGIGKTDSHRWQRGASVSDDEFEASKAKLKQIEDAEVEAAEDLSAQAAPIGHRPRGGDREAARRTGLSRDEVRRTKKHVQAAEKHPVFQGRDWCLS